MNFGYIYGWNHLFFLTNWRFLTCEVATEKCIIICSIFTYFYNTTLVSAITNLIPKKKRKIEESCNWNLNQQLNNLATRAECVIWRTAAMSCITWTRPWLSWGSNGERNFPKKYWEIQLWTQLTTGCHIVESVLAHASSLLVGQAMSRFDELSRLRNVTAQNTVLSPSGFYLMDWTHTNPTYQ